jgi:secreted PhoX family phosphatase
MKKLLFLVVACFMALGMFAQEGIEFDPSIDVNFTDVEVVQVPESPIKQQILFIGGGDEASSLNELKQVVSAVTKENNDFIGISPDGNGGYYISVNQERAEPNEDLGDGGGMTVFHVTRDVNTDTLQVVEMNLADGRSGNYINVDFENTVGETWINCGGIINDGDGRIWTAEEYPPSSNESASAAFGGDVKDVLIGYGVLNHEVNSAVEPVFKGTQIERYQNVGWMVEVDAKTGKALRKQYNWGRMSFEGGAMLGDSVVFLTDDATPGILTKFVADEPGDFTEGKLYVYNQLANGAEGNWIEMDNSNIQEMIHLKDSAIARGATGFIRLEWAVEVDGKIYIAETGHDNVANTAFPALMAAGGNVAQHHLDKADAIDSLVISEANTYYPDFYGRVLVYDPAVDSVTVLINGGPATSNKNSDSIANYPDIHLSNPDGLGKIETAAGSFLLIQEDLNGSTYNRIPAEAPDYVAEMYMLDLSISDPTLNDLIRVYVGALDAELTGGNGTPDGKSILVNNQHPEGHTFPYIDDNGVTVALTGFDTISDMTSIHMETVDFANADAPQWPNQLIHQVLFVGQVDRAVSFDANGNRASAVTKKDNDFIGITPDGDDLYITVNMEETNKNEILGNGGGMTMFKVSRNADDSFEVDGIIEETDVVHEVNSDVDPLFEDEIVKRYQNVGWMVEIDPLTNKALRKQYNWGRMSFEGGAILNDSIVFLTDDDTPGILTKFVANEAGDFTEGDLFVYNQLANGEDGNWVKMDNDNLIEMIELKERAIAKGATGFIRLEWAVELDGKIYIAETGHDNRANSAFPKLVADGGNVAQHHIEKANANDDLYITADSAYYPDYYGRVLVYDPATDSVTTFLNGGPQADSANSVASANYPEVHLSNPDGLGKLITTSGNYLLIQEDLNGSSWNRIPSDAPDYVAEMYMLDVSISEPTLEDLIRVYVGALDAEITGGNGTPDGKSILLNNQHPEGHTYPYINDNGVTCALTGFDTITDMTSIHIEPDFVNADVPQYHSQLIHQELFVGLNDIVSSVDADGTVRTAPAKKDNDFIGITPDGDEYVITVNMEETNADAILGNGGGMTSFRVERDTDDSFIIIDGTTAADIEMAVESAVDPVFEGEVIKRYENVGWMVEIDPTTGEALRKQYNWGRMSFEGGAMINDSIVILTDDATPGILVKFVAKVKDDFTDGDLFVYNQDAEGPYGNWIKIDNSRLDQNINMKEIATEQGATGFIRLEWAVEVDGKVYIAETGHDSRGGSAFPEHLQNGGTVAQHHIDRAAAHDDLYITADSGSYYDYYGRVLVYDPVSDSVTVFLNGGPQADSANSVAAADYPEVHLSNPDGLGALETTSGKYLLIQEDLNGGSWNRIPADAPDYVAEMYMLDLSITEPTLNDLIRVYVGALDAELTGGNGTPDGKSIVVNNQHPEGLTFPYIDDNGVTVALTGFDTITDMTSIHIEPDFVNADEPQWHNQLIHQVLFVGQVDSASSFDSNGDVAFAVTKKDNDFIGITPDGDDLWLSVNMEETNGSEILGNGGGMTTFKVERGAGDSLMVVETTLPDGRISYFHNVIFDKTVGETWNNCGGIISSTGRIWTAEEYPPSSNASYESRWNGDTLDFKIGWGTVKPDAIGTKYVNVDFVNTVGETWNNCGGIISDNGRIWTAEEYPPSSNASYESRWNGDTLDFMIGTGTIKNGVTAGKYVNVDFVNTVGETWNNCGGIISDSGRIWTAEEYPPSSNASYETRWNGDTLDFVIGYGTLKNEYDAPVLEEFKETQIERYQNVGWMVEIDPENAKAVRKQYNWGRMSFEGGAILNDSVVYLSEDGTPGMFTKFVADEKGDFTKGNLYVFSQTATGENGHWIEMDNSNITEMINLADSAYNRGATAFIRLEWVTAIDGKIYIAETGLDNPSGLTSAVERGGDIATHHVARANDLGASLDEADFSYYDRYGRVLEYDPATDEISVYLSGGPDFAESASQAVADYPAKHLSNPDGLGKITVNNHNYMIICEDLNGSTYNRVPAEAPSRICEMYLLDMSVENPTVDDLTRIMVGPDGAELTGGNGTPDGKTILVNVQHPSSETYPYTSEYGVTVALTGFDYAPSNENDIISFVFNDLDPAVTATITDTNIVAVVPQGTDINGLVPTLTISDMATVSPESGVAQDFTYPVMYLVTSESGAEKEFLATVTVIDNINEHQTGNSYFTIYPNPASRNLYFNNEYSVAIYNAKGTLVKTKENAKSINISELPAGVYYIKNNEGVVKKLVIE